MSEVTGLPEKPLSRTEQYLASMAGQETELPEKPLSRVEQYLDYIVKHGGGGGGMTLHVCTVGEYDSTTRVPTIQSPDENTIYLVPASDSQTGDLFIEWYYTNDAWEQFGRAKVDISGLVSDVKVNGTSVVTDGVAEIPVAGSNLGVVKINTSLGIRIVSPSNELAINYAESSNIKAGTSYYNPVTPRLQHESAFFGLAKAAGADMKDIQNPTVGVYPELQKSAISQMLSAPETISGSTPSITAKSGVQYICGEVSTIDITVPESGIIDVIFESGSTPAVLTVTPPTGVTVVWPDWFDPTALEANKVYEVNIANGRLATVMVW